MSDDIRIASKSARPRRRRRFRFGMRGITLAGAALAGLVAATCFWLAWEEHRTISALRERGALAAGQYLRTVQTSTRDSSGFTESGSYRVWAYRAAGRRYEVVDNYRPRAAPDDAAPRLGPMAEGQIVYLPERPGEARMRAELSLDLLPFLGTGGMFLLIALVFGGVGVFLLRPRRGLGG